MTLYADPEDALAEAAKRFIARHPHLAGRLTAEPYGEWNPDIRQRMLIDDNGVHRTTISATDAHGDGVWAPYAPAGDMARCDGDAERHERLCCHPDMRLTPEGWEVIR